MIHILNKAKRNKNDEFYTHIVTVDYMIDSLKNELENKVIYCNCDDYRWSNFYIRLKERFNELNLKTIYTSNYNIGSGSFICKYDGKNEIITEIENGSYDSDEVNYIYNISDIIMTNPPYSIKNIFIQFLESKQKDFILLLPKALQFRITKRNKIINLKSNKLIFIDKNQNIITGPDCIIYNTLKDGLFDIELNPFDPNIHNEFCEKTGYLNINRIKNIPSDYTNYMNVPITIVQYNIKYKYELIKQYCSYINNKPTFRRILIKKK